nr:50S ribosomal protein L1 [Hymenolepis microstoma]
MLPSRHFLRFPLFRSIHSSTVLCKGNQRYKERSSVERSSSANSRREWITQLRGTANRQKWEAEEALRASRKLIQPPPGLRVFFMSSFEETSWPIVSAIRNLRDAAEPEMYNCENNPLYAKIRLNMRTKKETRFISKLETSCTLPHALDFLPKRRIIVLTNDPEVAGKCMQSGAVAAGGADILGRLETGGFHWDEYDDVVAHPDFVDSINKVRKILQNRLPTVKNGRMGENVLELLTAQQDCILVCSTAVEGVPEINEVEVVLGQLSWDELHCDDNLGCYLNAINKSKSSRLTGDFIERVELVCPPIDEVFSVNFRDHLEESSPAENDQEDDDA